MEFGRSIFLLYLCGVRQTTMNMRNEDFTEEELAEIDEAISQIERGECTRIHGRDELIGYLDSL